MEQVEYTTDFTLGNEKAWFSILVWKLCKLVNLSGVIAESVRSESLFTIPDPEQDGSNNICSTY